MAPLALWGDAFTNSGGELALEPTDAWPAHGPPLRGDVRAALEALAAEP